MSRTTFLILLCFASAPAAAVPLTYIFPTSVNYAAQPLGKRSATQTVNVTNTGNTPWHLGDIKVTGDFVLGNLPCVPPPGGVCAQGVESSPTELAPNRSFTLPVSFVPSALYERAGRLTIVTDAPNSPRTVFLSGIGERNRPDSVCVEGFQVISFPEQIVGTTSAPQEAFTLTSLTSPNIATSGDFSPSTDCPAQLPAGQTCKVVVTFTPSIKGPRRGTMARSDAGPGCAPTVIAGVGLAAPDYPNRVFDSRTAFLSNNNVLTGEPGMVRFSGGTDHDAQWQPVAGPGAAPRASSAPVGYTFPLGLLGFTVRGVSRAELSNADGTKARLFTTIDLTSPLPAGSVYWKYGPTPDNPSPPLVSIPCRHIRQYHCA